MNGKISVLVICVEATIFLLLHNLHDCTINRFKVFKQQHANNTNTLFKINTNKIYLLAKKKAIDNIRRTAFEFTLIKSQITIPFYNCCKLYR